MELKALYVAYSRSCITGPNVWLMRSLTRIKKYGIKPHVLLLHTEKWKTPCHDRLIEQNTDYIFIPRRKYVKANITNILQAVKKLQPDVFIANNSLSAAYASHWIKKSGIPTVAVLRSDELFYHELIERFISHANKWRLSAAVCVSEFLADNVNSLTPEDYPLLTCPSGAPIPSKKAHWANSPFEIVYAGRIEEKQKRIFLTLEVMKYLANSNSKLHFNLYGSGTKEDVIWQLLKNEQQVDFVGQMPPWTIQKKMLNAQAFLLLSDWEGLSTSLTEAMACGLVPIVRQTKSGTEELITHNKNGFLLNGDNIKEKAREAVNTLTTNPKLWKKMSRAARLTIKNKFSSEIGAKRWAAFLKKLAANKTKKDKSIRIPGWAEMDLPAPQATKAGIGRLDNRINSEWKKHLEKKISPLIVHWLNKNQDIAIYGTGEHTEILLALFPELTRLVDIFIDRKGEGEWLNKKITIPNSLPQKSIDVILYSSLNYENEMYQTTKHCDAQHVLLYQDTDTAVFN